MTKKELKKADEVSSRLFKELGYNIQFNIFNLGKIFKPTEQIYLETKDEYKAREVMVQMIAQYREDRI